MLIKTALVLLITSSEPCSETTAWPAATMAGSFDGGTTLVINMAVFHVDGGVALRMTTTRWLRATNKRVVSWAVPKPSPTRLKIPTKRNKVEVTSNGIHPTNCPAPPPKNIALAVPVARTELDLTKGWKFQIIEADGGVVLEF